MADESKEQARSWMASEEAEWETMRKREQRKRDFFWLLIALLLLFIGNLTGLPGRFFT